MDPAPRGFSDLPRDPTLGVPVPFACGMGSPGAPAEARSLDRQRVVQCALSRVCGVCGAGLGRPLTLLGSATEVGRCSFLFPPSHLECAVQIVEELMGCAAPVLGQDEVLTEWHLVTTGGFEFVRPSRDDLDQRAHFEPNSVLSSHQWARHDTPHTVG